MQSAFNYRALSTVPSEGLEKFRWSTVIIEIKRKKRQLQFKQLKLRVNGIIALSAFHFRIIVRAKLRKVLSNQRSK